VRKSSRGAPAGLPPAAEPVRIADDISFQPTTSMVRARSDFWCAYRDDPRVAPANVTADEAAQMANAPAIKKWWSVPGFKPWFLQQDSWRKDTEFAFSLWAEEAAKRLQRPDMLATKEFTALGRTLAEVTQKLRGEPPKERDPFAGMSRDQLRAALEPMIRELGFVPDPAQLPPAPPSGSGEGSDGSGQQG
jgi:hypothetical protein